MIYNFEDFLIEHSKSDPIPELTWKKDGKVAIFLFGPPGAGKSVFIRNFILPKLRSYKIFDPDKYIQKLLKIGRERNIKTPQEKEEKINSIKKTINKLNNIYNVDIKLSDENIINIIDNNLFASDVNNILGKQLFLFIENSNSDFIYDTTGNNFDKISEYSKLAKENGYTILFIKIKTSLNNIVHGNLNRNRIVQPDYQLYTYERSKELEIKYLDLNPDAYYLYNRDAKNKWEKLK